MLKWFKVFALSALLFVFKVYPYVLYESPFKFNAGGLESSLVRVGLGGEEKVCGIVKGNLVCFKKDGTVEKVVDIDGSVQGAVFLPESRCFEGLSCEGYGYSCNVMFRACLDGSYEKKEVPWGSYSLEGVLRDSEGDVYGCYYDYDAGKNVCMNLDTGDLKDLDDFASTVFVDGYKFTLISSNSVNGTLVFEYDLIGDKLVGMTLGEYYTPNWIICPVDFKGDLAECDRLIMGETYAISGISGAFLFLEGDNLYVVKRVQEYNNETKEWELKLKAGVFKVDEAREGLGESGFIYLPYYGSDDLFYGIYGFGGTPYIFAVNLGSSPVYTIHDGRLEVVSYISIPNEDFQYAEDRIWWLDGGFLVSLNPFTGFIKAYSLPWVGTDDISSLAAVGSTLFVALSVNRTESCYPYACYTIGVVALSADGKIIGKKEFEGTAASIYKLDESHVAVIFKGVDNEFRAVLYDTSFNEIGEIRGIPEYFKADNLVQGRLIGYSWGNLYIYDLASGSLEKTISPLSALAFSVVKAEDGVLIGGTLGSIMSGSDSVYYAFSSFDELFSPESYGLEMVLLEKDESKFFSDLMTVPSGDLVYLTYVASSREGSGRTFRVAGLGVSNKAPILRAYGEVDVSEGGTYVVASVKGRLSAVFRERDGERFSFFPLDEVARPLSLSGEKRIKLGWYEYFVEMPYPLGLPLTLKNGFYIDTDKKITFWSEDEKVTAYIATPRYDVNYDFYIAVLGLDGSLHFISKNGFSVSPEPLFENLSDGMLLKFDNIPASALPKGTYYVMVRKSGTSPLDFENPGYIIFECFSIK